VVQKTYDLCAHDMETRALIIWQTLVNVLSDLGIEPSETLAVDLKDELLKHATAIYSYPYECLQQIVRNVGIGVADLTEARDLAIEKVKVKIDLFALSLLRRAAAQSKSSQPIFNIYSSVGAIQTGPAATANVFMPISPQEREALLDALELVKNSLANTDLPGQPKEEVLDIVEETKTEVSKERPNRMRISSLLKAVATAIQTVGSLQPAYQTLKAALLPFGISLP